MPKKKASRNISSLEDRIDLVSVSLGEDDIRYSHQIADGVPKSRAFINAYGYVSHSATNTRLAKVYPLVILLKEQTSDYIHEQLHMDKTTRLENILETALIARHKYQASGEASHGAVYLKAMAIINTMTGDNAPTEVHHMVSVTSEQLEAMTHSQRTESYKRMMSGRLQLIDEVIEGEVIQ